MYTCTYVYMYVCIHVHMYTNMWLYVVVWYLSAFLSDSVSSFLGAGVVFDTDLVMDGVKKSSSSDIESKIPPTFLTKVSI